MRNKRLIRIALSFFFLFAFLLVANCCQKRVPLEGRHPPPGKKAVKKGVYHVVERHQTLYRICKTYGVDIHEVASINGIADHSKIQTGQRIFIPGARKVLKVEIVLDDVAAEQVPRGKERPKTVYEKMDFIWPVQGRLGDGFKDDERKSHQGIDILSPLGTPIKASGPGIVIYSGNTIKGYGNMVIVRHSEEYVTVYAHNQVNLVEEGDQIEKGQVIGKVGQTGRASGPHLHFEIRRNNKPVNPM
ncbi:MAG: peptidoglycan DD-metalloendopeptidase family protein, partial [Thermodesulfobacteriota bacterium]